MAQTRRAGQQLDECDRAIESGAQHPQAHRQSYHPTGNARADAALDMIDRLTTGRADWFQRAFSYLIFGGFSAVVNLVVFSLIYYQISWPANQQWHYALAFAAASEVSILVNFFPNDALTFRYLAGHSRPWPMRCLRFHGTYLLGSSLQLLLSFSLHLLNCPAVLAQALAIALVTAFNFAFHHIFTYRGPGKHPLWSRDKCAT